MLAAIFKMAAKSIWDQKVKKETTVFKFYILYYLDDFKTCCQDYTQKYAYFALADVLPDQSVPVATTNFQVNLA